ncbi:MAG: HEAT repeat domain-containing protein [Candidatus Jettenia sp.]|uniref:HEAT repeat domain-containing protein n=1 Tax=Candidatus Jettenia caeni TaxID=247490 RepID=I3IIY1_9BACT|nr:HEAT repeat domain-containing protein [Candidatus Jettenia sp. AMX1]MBC6930277.1 HEAT repeat domain-containing protein [Candidatus Jettenia sp.]NUN23822.1 HEAT repeat domain-containing protein [Candidatus Jettenia caeni]KAA0247900.1 MAG: HEAT repeat domain-containing protein [Candidatus Jettenia sp. AMX1]MCE7881647.1 HEAT repeat domain-containing protein [Candidatus Jettenia sp. AMX1]MCQ3928294.1 HEAT repeat domain-containing protein [Candidatus Jettenia sp.]
MTFFCPLCWKEIKEIDLICPFCGADILEYVNKDFEEKLVNALRHPERETVRRAIHILGKLKSTKAVRPIIKLFKQTDNTFLKMEILNTLNEVGIPETKEFMLKVIDSDVGLIKRMAKSIISKGFTEYHEK